MAPIVQAKVLPSPFWERYVPKMATLFIHRPTNINKEIMFKYFCGSLNDVTIEVRFLENLIDIGTAAMHLSGEPGYRTPLIVKNCLDDMSYMKLCHPPCIKLYRELLSEVEVLEYPLSQQESPRYIHVSILTFLVTKLKFSRFPPTKDKRKRLFCYL